MAIKIISATHLGLDGVLITVEVDIMRGLPTFNIVGLPDTSIKESKERVRAAIINSGFEFPLGRITINLAPADVRKIGTLLDLPIAIGILMASGQVVERNLDDYIIFGELSLNGCLTGVKGAVPIIFEGDSNKKKNYIFPLDNLKEIRHFTLGNFYPFKTLKEVKSFIENEDLLPYKGKVKQKSIKEFQHKFEDIVGQFTAKRAMEITAAGNHNIILYGSPGAGKTMLAKALPSILPPLTVQEQCEIAKIYSISGLWKDGYSIDRPFRAPHHTTTKTALIGGGKEIKAGEITLAHNGVLFLDEILEFKKDVLEVLRQPLEERVINIARLKDSYTLPSNFLLVGTLNPCPCGMYLENDYEKNCRCTENERKRYINKMSRALEDRIDLLSFVPRLKIEEINDKREQMTSDIMRQRVMLAREMQLDRYDGMKYSYNSEIVGKDVIKLCNLKRSAKQIIDQYYSKFNITLRGYTKIIKVARTIADLDGNEEILDTHIIEALGYRRNVFGEII